MRFGNVQFRPGLWPSLITLVVFGILLSLGFWQLDRAGQKRALLAEYRAGESTAQVKIDASLNDISGLQYQPAMADGRYDQAHQFLLDNRIHNGMVGYDVLTPLKLDKDVGVLVNRGWVPLGSSRERLPPVEVDGRRRTVTGRIRDVAQKGFSLGVEQPRSGWPYRILQVDVPRLAKELGYRLLPLELLLDPSQPDGYVREWHPVTTFGPERNVGYAVQWFALAATLMVTYLAVNLKKTGEP